MTVERPPGAIGFAVRIKMQDYAGNFTPVGAFCVGVEQTQIRDEVFLVIGGQYGTGGAVSATSGSSGGIRMGVSRDGCRSANFALGSLAS
jgi:hypothetical protein